MRTIIDEVLMERFPTSNPIKANCGCKSCNEKSLEEYDYESILDEILSDESPSFGSYYQIKKGDNLLSVTGSTYKLGPGEKRLKFAQVINKHPLNRKYWRQPSNDFEKKYFPEGIISFNPVFPCIAPQTAASKCYAKIWFPKEIRILPPDPKSTCAVPAAKQNREFEDFEFEQFEVGGVKIQPKICLFQNASNKSHWNHFNCQAVNWAKKIGAPKAPTTTSCKLSKGGTPFNTGADIISSMNSIHKCLNQKINTVHIFGHSGSIGIFGSTSGSAGLYDSSSISTSPGAKTISDIPTNILSNEVVFYLHGCNLGYGSTNFAKDLYDHLKSGRLSAPKVFAHFNAGCAGRDNSWKEYSNRSPNGSRKHKSILSSFGVKNCCS